MSNETKHTPRQTDVPKNKLSQCCDAPPWTEVDKYDTGRCSECGEGSAFFETETKTKHTPGPWVIKRDRDDICIDTDIKRIVRIYPHYADQEANAHLIAAAPEMLEMLKDVFNDRAKKYGASSSRIMKLGNLIKKAEGGK